MTMFLTRGDIVLAQLDPSVGSEANKTRPCVIVGNATITAAAGRHGVGVVTVVPLTRAVHTLWPHHVLLEAANTGLPHDSKAQVEQIRAIDVRRIARSLGSVNAEQMAAIDEALRFHLAI